MTCLLNSLHSHYSIPSGTRQVHWIDRENIMVEGLDPDALQYSSETAVELEHNTKYVFRLYAIEGTDVATPSVNDHTISGGSGNENGCYLCWSSIDVIILHIVGMWS